MLFEEDEGAMGLAGYRGSLKSGTSGESSGVLLSGEDDAFGPSLLMAAEPSWTPCDAAVLGSRGIGKGDECSPSPRCVGKGCCCAVV